MTVSGVQCQLEFNPADSVTVAQITYQSLFKLYPKLSGMTGTAKTEVWCLLGCFLNNLFICTVYYSKLTG